MLLLCPKTEIAAFPEMGLVGYFLGYLGILGILGILLSTNASLRV